MSWLFGTSKKKEVAPKQDSEAVISEFQVEGFDVVQTVSSYNSPIYPNVDLNNLSNGVKTMGIQKNTLAQNSSYNPLDSIPFRFAPDIQFEDTDNSSELDIIRTNLIRITQDLNSSCYIYDFKVEKTVVQEASLSQQ